MVGLVVSKRDPVLSATLLNRRELYYAEGADDTLDRPAHVRAGSSLAWFGDRIAVVQDDANFIALIDPHSGRVDALPLPAGEGGLRQFDDLRGNKRFKLDLEACFAVRHAGADMLVAMGSGSSVFREFVAVIGAAGQVRLVHAGGLYARLRSEKAFSGSELNVEGAAFVEGRVRLFNRGNGAWRGGVPPANATCDLPWPKFEAYLRNPAAQPPPSIQNLAQYDLGDIRGARLTFTDAVATKFGVLYSAAAEDSPDAVTDGAISGSAIGILDGSAGGRWIELRNANGGLIFEKVEGICPARGQAGRIYAVIDADDPARPSILCEVSLDGPWFSESGSQIPR